MESWGWSEQIAHWNVDEQNLFKSSWRPSTLSTYKAPLNRWIHWCNTNRIDEKSPSGIDIAHFLAYLFLKERLAYNTILIHKSAVLTYCKKSSINLTNNFFIHQILKAILLAKPKPSKPPIWDLKLLFDWLINSTALNTHFDIARRTALILLLASGRRLHDLTLLLISRDKLIFNKDTIILKPKFGSKTDTGIHQQSGWLLKEHPNVKVCPVYHIKNYW